MSFDFPPVRNFGGDTYSALGRALILCTRFEGNAREVAVRMGLDLATRVLAESPLEDDGFLGLLEKGIKKRTLGKHTRMIASGTSKVFSHLDTARRSRNALVHDIPLKLQKPPEAEPESSRLLLRIRKLARLIAKGDEIVCTLMCVISDDPIPDIRFRRSYPERAAIWVVTGNAPQ